MVRVFNQNAVVCEIVMLLEDNGVPLSAVDDILAGVKEEIGMMPVMIASSGLPAELGEEHGNAVIEEFRRRRLAYDTGYKDAAAELASESGAPKSEDGGEAPASPQKEGEEFYFGLKSQEGEA